jgi:hypothetical protein
MPKEIRFVCCFCSNEIPNGEVKGVALYDAEVSDDPGQTWFCHEGCFRDRILARFWVGQDDVSDRWEE